MNKMQQWQRRSGDSGCDYGSCGSMAAKAVVALADDRWWLVAAVALAGVLVVALHGSGGGGSKRQDDGGMEEVMTWSLFMYLCMGFRQLFLLDVNWIQSAYISYP